MDLAASRGEGVILSDGMAELHKLKLGDTFAVETPGGALRLPVLGIVRDYSNQLGSVFLDRSVYVRYYKDETVDIFRIYLRPGVSAADAKRRIIERFGKARRLFVMLNAELRAYVMRVTDQWLGMTYIQVIVAVLVAILGIVNTLTVSITDRRRELGVLRAVGGLRAQIRGTVWLEALAIGAIGLVLGTLVGAIQLFYELEIIRRDFTGMTLAYSFPVGITLLLVPVILGAAFASALGPAEKAVRSSLVEALEYE
jgi:putative ABC transport system permease protein